MRFNNKSSFVDTYNTLELNGDYLLSIFLLIFFKVKVNAGNVLKTKKKKMSGEKRQEKVRPLLSMELMSKSKPTSFKVSLRTGLSSKEGCLFFLYSLTFPYIKTVQKPKFHNNKKNSSGGSH